MICHKNLKYIDVLIGNLDLNDYPDFVDAQIEKAWWKDTGVQLSIDQIEFINANHYDFIWENAIQQSMEREDLPEDYLDNY